MGRFRVNAPQTVSPLVISLGCRLNIAESEAMRAMLGEDAGDIVVVNSCAVTNEAVRQTRQAIRRARRARPDARLIVTGCAAEIEREAIAAMPEVDAIMANAAKLDARRWNVPAADTPPPPQRTRAFIGVQNGCDHACTFCIIPQGRGKSRSLTVAEVLREVEGHLIAGAKEIVFTGVDLTSWGQDISNTPRLGSLIEATLNEFRELSRLRLSSVDGVEIDAALFDLLAGEKRVMPHVHLSLQHGADLILKRMKRRHSRADAVDLVARLKARRPDIAVGADLIAGFPTESEGHHADNLSIIAQCDIVHGHVFPFSPREGTPAARMPQHDRATVKARAAELRAAVAERRADWLTSLVGETLPVLAERDGTGYGPNYARVKLPDGTRAGEIVPVRVQAVEEGMLR
ncbi:threonylcarbamoyladenosine tRNA methylthiotransferase MtaB [Erythrobacter litoralis]|jgi:threonylcarbamoyladenosine tRNA methylthiotransferase MtaB|uniref:MiaB/RimO family radical SAM methylthiotransferase n=1 Tax=Erythrobacter litoralis TaxID=39960 RepID=UPI00068CC46E|nr:MiaB/RimO family radical SAM methylthiotransferase [Erythrobacter litoralis]AOL23890.1 threonylcarbamoyladenosine tRNA methylthiotransferase MtaB [Erythrobacter litoralis]MEE4337368.1 MiaB/RimO family radical SAM methylthiotransferase [Erythrobacter sp.]